MYAKCPAKCRRGMHFASILPRRPSFSVRIPQIMHSGQILPLFFDLSFVRDLCDSCLRGSSGCDQHRGSTFTGILACPLREGANAVACPLCGRVLASRFVLHWGLASWSALYVEPLTSWFILYVKAQALRLVPRWGVSAVARPLHGGASAVVHPRRGGDSVAVRSLCRNVSAARKKSRPVERRPPWQDLAAAHS